MLVLLLNKAAGNFVKKETPAQGFFCEYYEIFKLLKVDEWKVYE